ncbi:serine/threonine-protein kinase [Salinifilum ghardaiensis]
MLLDSFSSHARDQDAPAEPAGAVVEPGAELAPNYRVVAHLRRGTRLDVYDLWSAERACRCVGKTLRPERAGDHQAAGCLRNEGVMLTQLTHPHLVRGYEITATHAAPARPVVITETLGGNTLGYLIANEEHIAPLDVAVLGIQLCSVLAYLHQRGWVHLDVKPSNIVASGGRAVLLDLSLACRIGEHSSAGTFDYLSPEQARGDQMAATADTWGLGVTLYEALSGAPPWAHVPHRERTASGDRYYPQLHESPEPLTGQRAWPRPLARVVDACLEADAEQRPDVLEVSAMLTEWCGVDPATVES